MTHRADCYGRASGGVSPAGVYVARGLNPRDGRFRTERLRVFYVSTCCPFGHNARRDVYRAAKTPKDLDQKVQLIDLDPKNHAAPEAQPLNFEKPGFAQHYCVECARYYETDAVLRYHWRGKIHKRRCKQLKEPAYIIEEAERVGREGKRPSDVDLAATM
ncbi:hypothetical protein GYMLUDRAFT_249675 [Collybiopsis luxurians FD-317 M1]|uniref:C2H2-type domain-containing protein n=1 Tax=Collybiopsis luxurians FD-317 M1 TaxID=944289 RepID=A0A0D0AUI1_9AGAR|nr:hypothetical protein GYMLUDRAFT_249675 [Collybiopsis luxurians FD-317 M1]